MDGCTSQATAEHEQLKDAVGKWKVACTYYMDPSQPPMENEATETVEMIGDLWAVSRFETDMMGAPFTGSATIGYEPLKQRWVSTWIDSMQPFLFHMTGGFDDSGKILSMSGDGPSMMEPGKMATYRTREEVVNRDERIFEMFVSTPDGNEHKMFRYVYTRAG